MFVFTVSTSPAHDHGVGVMIIQINSHSTVEDSALNMMMMIKERSEKRDKYSTLIRRKVIQMIVFLEVLTVCLGKALRVAHLVAMGILKPVHFKRCWHVPSSMIDWLSYPEQL